MNKKFYFEPEVEVVLIETAAILAGSGPFDDPDGEGGEAPMDDTPSSSDQF